MLDRKIVFYGLLDVPGKNAFDRLAAVKSLHKLPDKKWAVEENGIKMGVIVDDVGTKKRPTRLRFLRIRDDLPFALSPTRQTLPVAVQKGHQITEFTHVVIWPDNYMAAISSREAPNVKYLSSYFLDTSGEECMVINLYKHDTLDILKGMVKRGLKSAKVVVQESEARNLEKINKLSGFRPLLAAGRASQAARIEIKLTVGRYRDRTLSNQYGKETLALAEQGDLLESLVVTGKDSRGKPVELNLKKQRIHRPIQYSRDSQSTPIYGRIENARTYVEKPANGGAALKSAAHA